MAVLIFRHFIPLVYKYFPHKSESFARSTHPSHLASFLHQQNTQDIDKHTKQTAWCAQWIKEWTAFLYAKPPMYVCNASTGGSEDLSHCHMKSKHNKNIGVLNGFTSITLPYGLSRIYNLGSSLMMKIWFCITVI